jgi:hypothetical protein
LNSAKLPKRPRVEPKRQLGFARGDFLP